MSDQSQMWKCLLGKGVQELVAVEKPGKGTSFLNTRCTLLCHSDQITFASKLLISRWGGGVGYKEVGDGTSPEDLKRKY